MQTNDILLAYLSAGLVLGVTAIICRFVTLEGSEYVCWEVVPCSVEEDPQYYYFEERGGSRHVVYKHKCILF